EERVQRGGEHSREGLWVTGAARQLDGLEGKLLSGRLPALAVRGVASKRGREPCPHRDGVLAEALERLLDERGNSGVGQADRASASQEEGGFGQSLGGAH